MTITWTNDVLWDFGGKDLLWLAGTGACISDCSICSSYNSHTIPEFTRDSTKCGSNIPSPSPSLFLLGGDRLLGEHPDKWVWGSLTHMDMTVLAVKILKYISVLFSILPSAAPALHSGPHSPRPPEYLVISGLAPSLWEECLQNLDPPLGQGPFWWTEPNRLLLILDFSFMDINTHSPFPRGKCEIEV